jgi:hypothetical protein
MGRDEKEDILLAFGLSQIMPVAHWSVFFMLANIIMDKEKIKCIHMARNVLKNYLKTLCSYVLYYIYYNLIIRTT